MKIENSFIGGSLMAIGGYLFLGFLYLIYLGLNLLESILGMSIIQYFMYLINGGTTIYMHEIHLLVLKIIAINLCVFLVANFVTND